VPYRPTLQALLKLAISSLSAGKTLSLKNVMFLLEKIACNKG
jgi:hypothetical protein